mgnify:CR=1 FL=1
MLLSACSNGVAGASFDPGSPCPSEGQFSGAYPDLEATANAVSALRSQARYVRSFASRVRRDGAAIEARLNAEDPRTFAPSPGPIKLWHPPGGPGVRVERDQHLLSGDARCAYRITEI